MNSNDTALKPWLYGKITAMGWIGKPSFGGDFAFLAAYLPGDGELGPQAAQSALRKLVAAWGMHEGSMVENPEIHGMPVTAVLEGLTVTVLGLPGVPITLPVTTEWAVIARQHGQISFALTTRPWPYGPVESEAAILRFFKADPTTNAAVSMLLPVATPAA
ncbi:DUF5949 family protein [Streptomyces sp. NPDC058751]|uniref:DUF5949 family protein n=1 Tax=Streptomyces sp. NPDC058751 TaxID=3346623 RepID=UPI003679B62D